MTIDEQIALVRASKLMHPRWYARTYPDVAALGMDPVEHYLRYGAALGRNPAANFDAGFYRAAHPEAAAPGANPLLHHILSDGAAAGRATTSNALDQQRREARRRIEAIRRKLHGFGFVDRALAELGTLAAAAPGGNPFLRAHAAQELALWRLRARGPDDARLARALLPAAADCPDEPDYLSRLATLEMLCGLALDAGPGEADAMLARAEAAGLLRGDLFLARAGFAADPAERVVWINRALALHGIAPVALAGGDGTAYDRLACPEPGPEIADGPLVSVLVAAYDSAASLPTALGGLLAQRWRNLEILVVDDASRDDTAAVAARFAEADPRVRLIRMPRNGGAYMARNRGLAEARGAFVTLHDADDWSHPGKIATQAAFLIGHPEAVGCTSEQARATVDLVFRRLTRTANLINMNTSSFMFRRAYVRAAYGCWDTARFSADTELINRISRAEGRTAVRRLKTGPLSFQRVSATSIVADAHFGINGLPFGARLIYFDLYDRRHAEGWTRCSPDPAARAFPAPVVMRADRPRAGRRSYDVAFAGDLAASGEAIAAEMALAAAAGLRVAVFPVFDYDRPPEGPLIAAPVRDLLQAGRADVIAYGEAIDCRLLVLRDLGCFQDDQRYLPETRALAARFVIGASDLGEAPAARAPALRRAAEMARRRFGAAPDWRPADAAARAGLALAGAGAGADWDVAGEAARLAGDPAR